MVQVQMEYWYMDIWKVIEFNFLNEEVEEFTSRLSQNLVNIRNPSYLKQKNIRILFMRNKQIIYSAFHSEMLMCC